MQAWLQRFWEWRQWKGNSCTSEKHKCVEWNNSWSTRISVMVEGRMLAVIYLLNVTHISKDPDDERWPSYKITHWNSKPVCTPWQRVTDPHLWTIPWGRTRDQTALTFSFPVSLPSGSQPQLTAWVAQLAACSYSVGWYLRLAGTLWFMNLIWEWRKSRISRCTLKNRDTNISELLDAFAQCFIHSHKKRKQRMGWKWRSHWGLTEKAQKHERCKFVLIANPIL